MSFHAGSSPRDSHGERSSNSSERISLPVSHHHARPRVASFAHFTAILSGIILRPYAPECLRSPGADVPPRARGEIAANFHPEDSSLVLPGARNRGYRSRIHHRILLYMCACVCICFFFLRANRIGDTAIRRFAVSSNYLCTRTADARHCKYTYLQHSRWQDDYFGVYIICIYIYFFFLS